MMNRPVGEPVSGSRGIMMSEVITPERLRVPAIPQCDILWLTAGLSCDGDTISITAATQPSLEDIVLGIIPGLPKVRLHHPVLATEAGEAFLVPFRKAVDGKLGPFVLVVEGSIPNEKNKA